MHFLLNVLFGIIAFFLSDYALARIGATDPIKVVGAFIVGIVVYLANFAGQIF